MNKTYKIEVDCAVCASKMEDATKNSSVSFTKICCWRLKLIRGICTLSAAMAVSRYAPTKIDLSIISILPSTQHSIWQIRWRTFCEREIY